MQKICPILPKLNKKFIMDFIIFTILPIFLLIHSSDSSSTLYKCGGIQFDPTDSTNRCQDSRGSRAIGQPALKDMLCMKDPTMGCEQYTDQNGDRRFYCCPQLCDDTAKTRIDLLTTPRCTRGVCSTDTTKDCKHVSTGEDYCCPNAASPGAAGPLPGSGGSSGMATRRPGTSPDCEDFRTDCESKADLCIVEYAYERMYRDCPKTCNVCDGGGGTIECKDLGTDCPDRARDGYCDRAIYNDIMNWQCPKSCNRCGNRRPPRGNPLARSRLR